MSGFTDFVSNNSTLLNAGASLLTKLVGIAFDYVSASKERRAELLDQADQEYASFRAKLSGLDAAIAGNNKAADAELAAKFDHSEAPPVAPAKAPGSGTP